MERASLFDCVSLEMMVNIFEEFFVVVAKPEIDFAVHERTVPVPFIAGSKKIRWNFQFHFLLKSMMKQRLYLVEHFVQADVLLKQRLWWHNLFK